ncbi:hypothetical protein K402DRAFT_181291 [Aulographum hederae CBS 113979]|uniref:Uncharacterized protein n=1 Tax=Aulographum hederae CBS 113979 TaxID=1176131 RepID=A0A6G1GQG3_9PEZI|nr:hypothetical protein K402DRAFT_181291 [Aulographum hederae CBS 113979]
MTFARFPTPNSQASGFESATVTGESKSQPHRPEPRRRCASPQLSPPPNLTPPDLLTRRAPLFLVFVGFRRSNKMPLRPLADSAYSTPQHRIRLTLTIPPGNDAQRGAVNGNLIDIQRRDCVHCTTARISQRSEAQTSWQPWHGTSTGLWRSMTGPGTRPRPPRHESVSWHVQPQAANLQSTRGRRGDFVRLEMETQRNAPPRQSHSTYQ